MVNVAHAQGLCLRRFGVAAISAFMAIVLGWAWPSFAVDAPATSTPAALPPAVVPITEVHGTIPATLAGSWLAVFNTETGKRMISNWQLYRIVREDRAWHVQRYDRTDVPAFKREIDAARQNHAAFTPSAAAIKAVALALPKMKLLPEAEAFRRVVLSAGPQASAETTPPPQAQGSQLLISILEKTTGPTISTVSLYAKDVRRDRVTGDAVAAALAPGGLSVVPLHFAGRFTMYRLQ